VKRILAAFNNITTVLLLFLFLKLASAAGRFVANQFIFDAIDEYGRFAWVAIHHIVQMLLALFVIAITALAFALIWHLGAQVLGNVGVPGYPLSFTNIAGQLGFQLLLTGPSEEILFRALPITLLLYSFRESKVVYNFQQNMVLKNENLNISLENIIAAVLFTLAHVSWSLNPFSVSASGVQLTLSMILGLWYGVAYQKSKSIVYPMAMHSIWNVVMVVARYIHFAI